MNKYRIERVEWPKGEFTYYVQKRWLFWWLRVQAYYWGMEAGDREFPSMKDAEAYVKKYSFNPRTTIL